MLVAVDKEGACLRLMMLGSGGDREFPSKPKKWNGDGFAVLVPCYKPSCKVVEASNKALLGLIKNLSNEFSSGKFYAHASV